MPRKKADEQKLVDPTKIPREDTRALISQLQADLGGEGVLIQSAREMEGRFDLRRPCGIPSLDIACGGGLPAGGLSQIDGPEGVGKNLLLNYYFAENQRIHGNDSRIFMLCLEFPYDKAFARACGVKVALSPYEIHALGRKRHQLGLDLTGDEEEDLTTQTGELDILRGAAAEKLLEAVVRLISSNSYQIGGIDSWDAMLTAADQDRELEDNAKVADPANVQTRWMRKTQGALTPVPVCPECGSRPLGFNKYGAKSYAWSCKEKECGWTGKDPYPWENETAIVGIRQVRANLMKAGPWARDWKVGGSHALKHGKLVDIQLRPGKPIKDNKGNRIAKEIVWELTKGKAGTHEGKTGMYTYYYSPPEIDVASDIVNYCIDREVFLFDKRKWFLTHDGLYDGQPDPIEFGSREAVQRAVEDQPELREVLRILMLRKADLGHIRYR